MDSRVDPPAGGRPAGNDLFRDLPVAAVVLDADECLILEANEAAAVLLEIPCSQLLSRELAAREAGEDGEGLRRLFASGRQFRTNCRVIGARGELEVEAMGTPVVHRGSPACLVVLTPLTVKAPPPSQLAEATLAGLVSAAREAVLTIDGDLRITSVNPAALNMFRVTEKEAVGALIARFIPVPYQEEYGARLLAFGLTGDLVRPASTDLLLVRADGEVFVGSAGVARVQTNGQGFIGMIVRDVTAQREMESALQDTERRFQLLTSVAPVGIVRADAEGLCIYINDEGCALLGRTREQVLGKPWRGFIHPDDRLLYGPSWDDAVARAQPLESEYRLVRPDGEERWVMARARPELDEEGDIRAYTGAFNDITERRLADERLARSRELLGALIDASPLGILIFQADGMLIRTNDAARKILGLASQTDLLGEYNVLTDPLSRAIGSAALFEPAFRGEVVEVFARDVNFAVPENDHGIRLSARVIDELMFPIMGPQREVRAVIAFIHDVTERHEAEEAARAAVREVEHFLKNALDSVVEGFIVFDTELRCIGWNRFMETATGTSASQVIGLLPAEAFPEVPQDQLDRYLRQALAGETVTPPDALYSRPGFDRETWMSPIFSPWRDAAGNIGGVVVVVQDVTTRKRNEETLRHVEKLESLSVLAGGIAHDFNNLFGAILGNTEMALMDLAPDAPMRTLLGDIMSATVRAAELSSQMLAYSGQKGPAPQPVDIAGMVGDTARRVARAAARSNSLELALDRGLPRASVDLSQIRLAVTVLLTNAFEALPENGARVRVAASLQHMTGAELARTYLAPKRDGGAFVRIEVRDNGHGMDAETLRRAFDPFYSTRFTGRGLGLPAVLAIVQGHAGAIDVRSTAGQGTTVTLYFPVA